MVTRTRGAQGAILTKEQLTDRWLEVEDQLGPTIKGLFQEIGFKPSRKQLEILAGMEWFTLVSGGIQGGKTILAVVIFLIRYFEDFVRYPDLGLGEREYWLAGHRMEDCYYEYEAMKNFLKTLGLLSPTSIKTDPPRIILNDGYDTVIKVKFTSDPSKLSGVSPLGIIMCEAANITKFSFDTLTLRRTGKDAWMYGSGTFEKDGHPWFAAKFMELLMGKPRMKAFKLATYDNEALFPLGKDDPKIQEQKELQDERFFMERVEGTPAPPLGLVYPEFNVDHHLMRDYEYQEDETLYIWSDPGFDNTGVVLFAQFYGGKVYVFDEIYATGLTVTQIIQVAQNKPWWLNKSKRFAQDPWYGGAHHSQSSPDEIWQEKAHLTNLARRHKIEERIQRVKQTLILNPETGEAGLKISVDCPGLLSEFGIIGHPKTGELRPYRYEVDNDGQRIGTKPKPGNDHASDALGIGLMDLLGAVMQPYDDDENYEASVSTIESRGDMAPFMTPPGVVMGAPQSQGIYYAEVSTPESRGEVWYLPPDQRR